MSGIFNLDHLKAAVKSAVFYTMFTGFEIVQAAQETAKDAYESATGTSWDDDDTYPCYWEAPEATWRLNGTDAFYQVREQKWAHEACTSGIVRSYESAMDRMETLCPGVIEVSDAPAGSAFVRKWTNYGTSCSKNYAFSHCAPMQTAVLVEGTDKTLPEAAKLAINCIDKAFQDAKHDNTKAWLIAVGVIAGLAGTVGVVYGVYRALNSDCFRSFQRGVSNCCTSTTTAIGDCLTLKCCVRQRADRAVESRYERLSAYTSYQPRRAQPTAPVATPVKALTPAVPVPPPAASAPTAATVLNDGRIDKGDVAITVGNEGGIQEPLMKDPYRTYG